MFLRPEMAAPVGAADVRVRTSRRVWNGMSVNVSEWHGSGRVTHRFPDEGKTRLVALLEEVGSPCEPRLRKNLPCPVGYTPRHADLVPAGMEMWGHSDDARYAKDAALVFDRAVLAETMAADLDVRALDTPRLRFSDERIWPLMKMLAEVVDDPDPSTQLYGDGLTTAIIARLFLRGEPSQPARGGLAPGQLRRVVDYMRENLHRRVELAELSGLAGLSQAHFSRAFKTSTGSSPYRWQLEQRIRNAQAMLVGSDAPLDEVAEATGFADAVHFGRTFRNLTGATPAAWRRDRTS